MTYTELDMNAKGIDLWEHIAKSRPADREMAVQYFMALVRNCHDAATAKRAQQQAMAIYKTFGAALPEAYNWAVMAMLTQARHVKVSQSAPSKESAMVLSFGRLPSHLAHARVRACARRQLVSLTRESTAAPPPSGPPFHRHVSASSFQAKGESPGMLYMLAERMLTKRVDEKALTATSFRLYILILQDQGNRERDIIKLLDQDAGEEVVGGVKYVIAHPLNIAV